MPMLLMFVLLLLLLVMLLVLPSCNAHTNKTLFWWLGKLAQMDSFNFHPSPSPPTSVNLLTC